MAKAKKASNNAVNGQKDETKIIRRRVRRYATAGTLITSVGGLIVWALPSLLDSGFKSQMQLSEGSDLMRNWQNVPLNITIKVYVWHIENPRGFANGAKAKLKEMGPYYYNQRRWKEIISWGKYKETVKYWSLSSFYFDASRSNGRLSDRVSAINVPVYAMASVIKGLIDDLPLSFAVAPVAFGFVNVLFRTHQEGLIKQLTVGQLINGYQLSLLNTIDTLTRPLKWLGINLPDSGLPNNRYGILSVKNFTKSGPYEVYTGRSGTSNKFLQYVSYAGKKRLHYYNDPKCNLMNGTDGTVMGTLLTRDDTVYIFQGDACRSFYGRYKEDTEVQGISTYRFVLPASLFASPDKNPANKCFCRTRNYEKCDGILDLGPCLKKSPLAFSFPHFLHASKTIRNGVIGVKPDINKHESYFDIEPTIGAPLAASGKMQVNVLMKPLSLVSGMSNVREAVVPYVWIDESGGINEEYSSTLKMAIYPVKAIDYGSMGVFLLGIAVLAATGGYGLYRRKTMFPSKSEREAARRRNVPSRPTNTQNAPMSQNFLQSAKINETRKASPTAIKDFESRQTSPNSNFQNLRNTKPMYPQLTLDVDDDKPQSYPPVFIVGSEFERPKNKNANNQTSIKNFEKPPVYTVRDNVQKLEQTTQVKSDQSSNKNENTDTLEVNHQRTSEKQRISWSPPGSVE